MAASSGGAVIKWHGEQAKKRIQFSVEQKLDVLAESLTSQVKRSLNRFSTRSVGPSKPGEIPHRKDGGLIKSIFWDRPRRLTRRVATYLKYGLYLEIGTSKMAARPYLEPNLKSATFQSKIRRAMKL